MTTLVLHPSALSIVSPGESWAVLCPECHAARDASGALAPLGMIVVSGCCHDCGGGYCLCRGALSCDLCPRRNSPTVIQSLTLYRITPASSPAVTQREGA